MRWQVQPLPGAVPVLLRPPRPEVASVAMGAPLPMAQVRLLQALRDFRPARLQGLS